MGLLNMLQGQRWKTNNYLLLTTDPDKITDNVALF